MKYRKYLPKYLTAIIAAAMPLASFAIALSWGSVTSAQEIRTLEDYLEECIPESDDDDLIKSDTLLIFCLQKRPNLLIIKIQSASMFAIRVAEFLKINFRISFCPSIN